MKSLNNWLCLADAASNKLTGEFAFTVGHQLQALIVERGQPIADQSRLPSGRGGLLLQQVLLLHGLVPLLSRWVREQQPRDAAALGHHQ
jgi:hypothetical protein